MKLSRNLEKKFTSWLPGGTHACSQAVFLAWLPPKIECVRKSRRKKREWVISGAEERRKRDWLASQETPFIRTERERKTSAITVVARVFLLLFPPTILHTKKAIIQLCKKRQQQNNSLEKWGLSIARTHAFEERERSFDVSEKSSGACLLGMNLLLDLSVG